MQLAACHVVLKEDGKALALIRKLMSGKTYQSLAYIYFAQILIRQKMYRHARTVLIDALAMKDAFAPLARYFLAQSYWRADKKRKATRQFNRFIKAMKKDQERLEKALQAVGIFDLKKYLKTGKKLAAAQRKRSAKDQRWEINAVQKSPGSQGQIDWLYAGTKLDLEYKIREVKAPDATKFAWEDKVEAEYVVSPAITIGLGPFAYANLDSRLEFNFLPTWYTEDGIIISAMEGSNESIFSSQRLDLTPEFILDQSLHFFGAKAGYNLVSRRSYLPFQMENAFDFVNIRRDLFVSRFLPWVSFQLGDQFRTRLFYRYEFFSHWLMPLETHYKQGFHLGQDFFVPEIDLNAYLEVFYQIKHFEVFSLKNSYAVGGVFGISVDLLEAVSLQFNLAVVYENYRDFMVRYPKAQQHQGKSPFDDAQRATLQPGQLKLENLETNAELQLTYTFLTYNRLKLTVYAQDIGSTNYIKDYDSLESGVQFVYQYCYPSPNLIRNNTRYGYADLF